MWRSWDRDVYMHMISLSSPASAQMGHKQRKRLELHIRTLASNFSFLSRDLRSTRIVYGGWNQIICTIVYFHIVHGMVQISEMLLTIWELMIDL